MDSPESPLEAADGITKYGHGKNLGFWLVHGINGSYSNMAHAHRLQMNVFVSTSKTIHSILSTGGSIGIDAKETLLSCVGLNAHFTGKRRDAFIIWSPIVTVFSRARLICEFLYSL